MIINELTEFHVYEEVVVEMSFMELTTSLH